MTATIEGIEKLTRPAVGWYTDMAADRYHAIDAASSHRLGHLLRSPKHCRDAIDSPDEPTPAMMIGDATHLCILQPELFDKRYVVADRCSAYKKDRTPCNNHGKFNVGGEWLCGVHVKVDRHDAVFASMHEQFTDAGYVEQQNFVADSNSRYYQHPDGRMARIADHEPNFKTSLWIQRNSVQDVRVDQPPYGNDDPRRVLAGDEMDLCLMMRDAVYAHPTASAILTAKDRVVEASGFFIDPETKQLCKIRPDAMIPSERMMVDIKTCDDASRETHQKSIKKFGYHCQGGFYLHGSHILDSVPCIQFWHILVEKGPRTFGVAVRPIGIRSLEQGKEDVLGLLAQYHACEAAGEWPGYPDDLGEIDLPEYDLRKKV